MAHTRFIAPSDFLPGIQLSIDGSESRLSENAQRNIVNTFGGANLGLLWSRYFPAHNLHNQRDPAWGSDFSEEWKQATSEKEPEKAAKRLEQRIKTWKGYGALRSFANIGNDLAKKPEVADLVSALHVRREALLGTTAGSKTLFKVTTFTRSTPGAGNPSSFENSGITLHHTYGFPILPEGSLKGLVRHYVKREVMAAENPDETLCDLARRLSGQEALNKESWTKLLEKLLGTDTESAGKDPDSAEEGGLAFQDGWPCAGTDWFDVDVLTVHHGDYYGDKTDVADDTDRTVPAHFLTLAIGLTFCIPIGISGIGRKKWTEEQQAVALDLATRVLGFALYYWGIGARTGAGFGRALIHS